MPCLRESENHFHYADDHSRFVADVRSQVAELRPGDVRAVRVQDAEPREISGVVSIAADLPLHFLSEGELLVHGNISYVERLAPDVGEARREGAERERRLRGPREQRRIEPDIVGRVVLRASCCLRQRVAL